MKSAAETDCQYNSGCLRGGDRRLRTAMIERDRLLGIANRVAGSRLLQPHRRRDIARANFLDLLPLVGVHLQNPTDPLFTPLHGIEDGIAGLHHATINAEKDELPNKRVGHDLERQPGKRLLVRSATLSLITIRELALNRRNVDGRRHVVDHRVEHRLHALVLERGAAQHRHDLTGDRPSPQRLLEIFLRQVPLFEVLIHHLFGRLCGRLNHLLAPLSADIFEVRRNGALFEVHPLGLVVPENRLHLDQINHTLKPILGTNGHLDGHASGREP